MSPERIALFALVVATLGLLASTVYTALTWGLFGETRRLRLAQTRADVIVYLEQAPSTSGLIDMVVRNVGPGTAYRVRLEMVEDWVLTNDGELAQPLSQLGIVARGLDVLAPGSVLRTLAGSALDVRRQDRRSFTVRVHFSDSPNATARSAYFRLDFASFEGIMRADAHLERRAADALKRIAERLDRLGTYTNAVHVDVWTRADRKEERAAIEARWAAEEAEAERAATPPDAEHPEAEA